MSRAIESLRNIGIIAHIDAGKTTTTERILFYTGASHRMGNVDDGTTQTDFDPEEAQRGITIYSAAVTCEWKDCTINIIDTPGHVDFTAEVERSLRVLDGAVVIFSAVEGVEAQSETVWRQATKYSVPRMCLINKMDRIGAGFERVIDQMKSRLQASPVAVQIPIGRGPAENPDGFTGIIDLIRMRSLFWEDESRGATIREEEIAEELHDEAETWRAELIDTLSSHDDELMESYLEDETVTEDQVHAALRRCTIAGIIQPVLCGSSLDYIGVQPVLDGVAAWLPSPLDRPPVEGTDLSPKRSGETITRSPSPKEPVTALVFKIQAEPHGDLYFTRVYSGVLKGNARLINPRTGKKELVTQLWHIHADSREKVETVEAGDICGIIGPRYSGTGDTLCDPQSPVLLEQIVFPQTVISVAVEPETSAERKKLDDVLARLERQDPTFQAQTNPETGQTIISGMGELHLEVIRHRMERDFNLRVKFHKPRVSYRETIIGSVTVEHTFQRQLPSGPLSFGLKLVAEQTEDPTTPVSIQHRVKSESIPQPMLQVLLESLEKETDGGGIYGNPLLGIKLTVLDVDYSETESNEVAIRTAAAEAFRRVLSEGNLAVLEPIMQLDVVTPEEFMGNIQSDLNSRRVMIVDSQIDSHLCSLKCEAPLKEMFGYSSQIRSLSQGRASYSMEPLRYEIAPPNVVDGLM